MTDRPIIVNRTMDDVLYPTCDWCGAAPMPRPCRAYPANGFAISMWHPELGEITHEFVGDGWVACARCWPHVETQSLDDLIRIFLDEHPSQSSVVTSMLLIKAWRLFFANQTGPGIEHDPDDGLPVFP